MVQEDQRYLVNLMFPNCQAVQKDQKSQTGQCLQPSQVDLFRQVIQSFLTVREVQWVLKDLTRRLFHLVQIDR